MSGFYQSYAWLKKYNVFPDKGGWTDQSVQYIRMVEWCDLVNSKWTSYKKERDKANAKLTQQMGAIIGQK